MMGNKPIGLADDYLLDPVVVVLHRYGGLIIPAETKRVSS